MSFNDTDNDFAKTYLSKMDDVVFLSKEDQIEIGLEIKQNEHQILIECTPFPLFRDQLYSLKDVIERNDNNIFKLSKHLDHLSKKKDIKKISDYFYGLFDAIEASEKDKVILNYLEDINLSSSTINKLLKPIQDIAKDIESQSEEIKRVFKFLEIDSEKELLELKKNCDDSVSFRKSICRSLYTDESKLYNYFHIGMIALNSSEDKEYVNQIIKLKDIIDTLKAKVEEQRALLISSNLPLVINRAKRYQNQGLDLEDLVQEGNIGLIKAVDKYEPSRNIKITTYATWWIDQNIRRSISNKAKTVRIPIHIQDIISKTNKSYHQLCQKLKKEPSLEEISADTGIALDKLLRVYETSQYSVGIDEEISKGVQIQDVLSDTNDNSDPFITTSKLMLKNRIRQVLSKLTPRNEKIIRLRFGIGETNEHTLEEIGTKFGVTRERIRQLEKRAKGKLLEFVTPDNTSEDI